MSKRLTKQQLRQKQKNEDRRFKKHLRNGVLIGFSVVVLIQLFFVHWCETRCFFRKQFLYGKEISPELICEVENSLKYHKASKIKIDEKTFYICNTKCKHYMLEHNQQFANTVDAYSGDSICKANAIVGLKEKGKASIAYFKNKQTFVKYYETKKSK